MFDWFKKRPQPSGFADQVLRQMEESLTQATTLQVAYQCSDTMTVAGEDAVRDDYWGKLVLGKGNCVRSGVETDRGFAGNRGPFDVASDGTMMTVNPPMASVLSFYPFQLPSRVSLAPDAPPNAVPAPERLDEAFRYLMSRYGATAYMMLCLPSMASLFPTSWSYAEWLQISDVESGGPETVDGQESQTFSYSLHFADCEPLRNFFSSDIKIRVRVWVGLRNGQLLKRITTQRNPDGSVLEFQNTYRDWKMDEAVDRQVFRIDGPFSADAGAPIQPGDAAGGSQMSNHAHFFLRDDRLPSVTEWQRALDQEKTGIVLRDIGDLRAHSGYLPARYKGTAAGFEWVYGPVADVFGDHQPTPQQLTEIGDRTHAVDFITHNDMRDRICGDLARAILAKITDGLVLYETMRADWQATPGGDIRDSFPLVDGGKALEHARKTEAMYHPEPVAMARSDHQVEFDLTATAAGHQGVTFDRPCLLHVTVENLGGDPIYGFYVSDEDYQFILQGQATNDVLARMSQQNLCVNEVGRAELGILFPAGHSYFCIQLDLQSSPTAERARARLSYHLVR